MEKKKLILVKVESSISCNNCYFDEIQDCPGHLCEDGIFIESIITEYDFNIDIVFGKIESYELINNK